MTTPRVFILGWDGGFPAWLPHASVRVSSGASNTAELMDAEWAEHGCK